MDLDHEMLATYWLNETEDDLFNKVDSLGHKPDCDTGQEDCTLQAPPSDHKDGASASVTSDELEDFPYLVKAPIEGHDDPGPASLTNKDIEVLRSKFESLEAKYVDHQPVD